MEIILVITTIILGYWYWRRGQQFDVMKAYALELENQIAKLENSNCLKNDQLRDLKNQNDGNKISSYQK